MGKGPHGLEMSRNGFKLLVRKIPRQPGVEMGRPGKYKITGQSTRIIAGAPFNPEYHTQAHRTRRPPAFRQRLIGGWCELQVQAVQIGRDQGPVVPGGKTESQSETEMLEHHLPLRGPRGIAEGSQEPGSSMIYHQGGRAIGKGVGATLHHQIPNVHARGQTGPGNFQVKPGHGD